MNSSDCDDSLIDVLPEEMLICIFKWLPVEDLVTCEDVCVKWQKLARDPTLWRRFLIHLSGKPDDIYVKQRALAIISSHSDLIYALKIEHVYNYPLIKFVINQCTNLVILKLEMCKIHQTFVVDVLKWPRLKQLSLNKSFWLGPDNLLIPFEKLKNLQSITLCDFGLYPENWSGLLQCRNLCDVDLKKINNLTIEFLTGLITAQLNVLESLYIYGLNSINANTLQLICNCPRLTRLGIVRCENLTDDSLHILSSLKSIKTLNLAHNSNFTEEALIATLSTPKFKNLRFLNFFNILNITSAVVYLIIDHCINLEFLGLYECPKISNKIEKRLKSKLKKTNFRPQVMIYPKS